MPFYFGSLFLHFCVLKFGFCGNELCFVELKLQFRMGFWGPGSTFSKVRNFGKGFQVFTASEL